jgi:hypothetical protein
MAKPTTKRHPWFELVLALPDNDYTEITLNSPEYQAWKAYFIGIEWVPATFRLMTDYKSWTAPRRWPNDLMITLPSKYPRSSYHAIRELSEPKVAYSSRQTDEMREHLDDLRRYHGPNWGLGRRLPRNERMLEEWRLGRQAGTLLTSHDQQPMKEAAE